MKTQRFKLYDLHQKNKCVDYIKELKNSSQEQS